MKWLDEQPEPFADLIFADPPFNIGYKYDLYQDRKGYKEYRAWTHTWMRACKRVLKPTGSFWVAIGDEYAAEVRRIGRDLKLHLRNWVIWHYTFGQSTKRKFARSHAHLFYWTADPRNFQFNEHAVRVFSDRQREYNDKRAHDQGKVPDDVWTEFPRVCGTFSERETWHPCQMPETILARIIRACSSIGDLVLDPFAGSGTTLVVAKKLNRRFVGVEWSKNYVTRIKQRLARVNPMTSIQGENRNRWQAEHKKELGALYLEMGYETDRLRKKPHLLQAFAQSFNGRLEQCGVTDGYTVEEVWEQLERLRKAGKLGRIRIYARESSRDPIEKLPPGLFNGDKHGPSKQGT